MKRITISNFPVYFSVLFAGSVFAVAAFAQGPAPAANAGAGDDVGRVIGEVRIIDLPGKRIGVKSDAGNNAVVLIDDKTTFAKVQPGEKTLGKSVKIAPNEIQAGDRILARGKAHEEEKIITALQVVVISKTDLLKKHEKEREEWARRSITGTVTALNPETRQISVQVRSAEAVKPLIVESNKDVVFRRYAPGSASFSSAQSSSFNELKVGDQVRVLGDKSSDGKRFNAQEIVSGSFRIVGGTVIDVIPARREVKLSLTNSNQELVVVIMRDTVIRRISAQIATTIAETLQVDKQKQEPTDWHSRLEQTPPMHPREIKPGDVVIVSGTQSADPSRLTALAYYTGLDVLLSVLQGKKPPRGADQRNLDTGLPLGVLEVGIGLP